MLSQNARFIPGGLASLNRGVVKPQPGYLKGLRALADRYGFLLIVDAVKTGFRASLGGYQTVAKVVPDLSAFGKVLANGFPIAALAGKQALMDLAISADATKRVLVAVTYNCHPVCGSINVCKQVIADVLEAHDSAFDTRYRRELLMRGIYIFPIACKQASISFAHPERDIERTLEATDAALHALTRK